MILFMHIESIYDYELLQIYLNRIVIWSQALNLKLNVSMDQTMTFAQNPIISHFIFIFYGLSVMRTINSVFDFGSRLSNNLCPRMYIEGIFYGT